MDRILADERVGHLLETYARQAVVGLARQHLAELRQAIAQGEPCPPLETMVDTICAKVEQRWQVKLKPVINATGIILHTNLGRAPLSQEAIAAVEFVARGYSNLEFALDSGERGSRQELVEDLLCQVSGAEAGLVVNNNAAAVLLGLTALVRGKEVIVSRGQAVEIGGGFRIPDVLRQSGARLVEVGTTNRTHLADYEEAITERTRAFLRVHSSNFRLIGFTEAVPLEDLVKLAHACELLVLDDVGSGCLLDTTQFGLAPEPTVPASLAAGADLVFFSGDKLLGGPQAGLIVGRKDLVAKLKRHPLTRALRPDKLCLAALGATLRYYLKGEALTKIPVWRMIAGPLGEIERRAATWADFLGEGVSVVPGESMVGGGSLPGETLPTRLVVLAQGGKGTRSAALLELARRLRLGNPPVVGRIEKNRLLLDPRTVLPEEDKALLQAVKRSLAVPVP